MEKDIEKMRLAVLAECEAVCPNPNDCQTMQWGLIIVNNSWPGTSMSFGKSWEVLVLGKPIRVCDETSDSEIELLYRLLGLSERDAVTAEKARSFKEIDSCTLSLGKMAIRAKVAEAKNAALVAALEDMYLAYGTTVKIGQLNGLRTVQTNIGRDIKHALAANEKGGLHG